MTSVERDVECRMRDGAILRADVHRPEGGGEHPVLLMRTPYGKTHGQSESGYHHPSWFAAHGYIVVVQDCRGRWASGGEFTPFLNDARTATTRSSGRRGCPDRRAGSACTATRI